MKIIDEEKAKIICKIGQGNDCCRYLAVEAEGFECLKHTTAKSILDYRVSEGLMTAQGDNCVGQI